MPITKFEGKMNNYNSKIQCKRQKYKTILLVKCTDKKQKGAKGNFQS